MPEIAFDRFDAEVGLWTALTPTKAERYNPGYNQSPMRPERIAELLAPYLAPCHFEPSRRPEEEAAALSSPQLHDISTYIDLLLRWNSRVNLTAIRDEEEIVTRHFGESLLAARHLFPRSDHVSAGRTLRLADLGSGAGFPGIPIKLWAPEVAVTLIESNHKKAAFLREVIRTITLMNIDVRNVRAEAMSQAFDVVTLRAVERFAEVLPVAFRLLDSRGRLALLIGASQVAEAHSILPSLLWAEPISVAGAKARTLLIGSIK